MSSANNIGIVILAAGSSSRLGKPKQLLHYDDKSLLQHAIDIAEHAGASSVIVVLGSNADMISKKINTTGALIIENKDWEEGMASSIRLGVDALLKISPSTETMIIMICDQPHVSVILINELIKTHEKSGKPIVACNYGDTLGPPALFHKKYFPELMELRGDAGARKVIQRHSDEVTTILFSKGSIDIDTMGDYDILQNS